MLAHNTCNYVMHINNRETHTCFLRLSLMTMYTYLYASVARAGVGLPGGPRPAKRPSGQPEPYYGWPGWPAIIFHKC